MAKLCTGYALYFNKKEHRVGPLFQGNFKARHARRDEYLKYLFAYIHLNPLKLVDPAWKENSVADIEKARMYLESYKYSSYPEFTGKKRDEAVILDRAEFPGYFGSTVEFQDLIDEWVRIRAEELI
jgi:putative transposase